MPLTKTFHSKLSTLGYMETFLDTIIIGGFNPVGGIAKLPSKSVFKSPEK
jgi:hypothetical protein